MQDFEVTEIIKYGVWILLGSGVLFEITPIKFSPISLFLEWFGSKINKDVKKDICVIQKDMTDIKSELGTVKIDIQDHKVESQRREILDFANALMRGEQKTKENFDYVIKLHDKYAKYIKDNNMENGQVDLAYEYIEEKFKEFVKTNGFL